jgi:hypothetical protein
MLAVVRGALLTKASLCEFVVEAGLETVKIVCSEEAAELAWPEGRRRPDRTAHHWGAARAELVMGGRKVILPQPRVRVGGGLGADAPSVARFSGRDPLTDRGPAADPPGSEHPAVRGEPGPLGVPVPTRETPRSAVGRTFVTATQRSVEEALSGRWKGWTWAS